MVGERKPPVEVGLFVEDPPYVGNPNLLPDRLHESRRARGVREASQPLAIKIVHDLIA
jgi:hypothetical protein